MMPLLVRVVLPSRFGQTSFEQPQIVMAMKAFFVKILSAFIFTAMLSSNINALPNSGKLQDEAIFRAASNGDVIGLKQAIKSGGNVNALLPNGLQPIHVAIVNNRLEAVKILLSAGAMVGADANQKISVLLFAQKSENNELLKLLLVSEAGELLRLKSPVKIFFNGDEIALPSNEIGAMLIISAAGGGDIERIKILLDAGVAVDEMNESGRRAIIEAIQRNKAGVVKFLLSKGASPELSDKPGWQPMHFAANSGNLEIVKMLLMAGANFDEKTKSGLSVLEIAAGEGHFEAVKYFLDSGAKIDFESSGFNGIRIIHSATMGRNIELVNLFLSLGAKVDAVENNGTQPIHIAANIGDIKLINLLIQHGASINAKSNDGRQPIHNAAYCGNLDAVKLLITSGAKADVLDASGETPVSLALKRNHRNVADYLTSFSDNQAHSHY